MNSNEQTYGFIVLRNGRSATHYCEICGALWQSYADSWSLISLHCGSCCDNAVMGDQIIPIHAPASST